MIRVGIQNSKINLLGWWNLPKQNTRLGPHTQLTRFFTNNIMETPAFVYAVFLWFLLLSITGYSIYVGFGPPSKELKDPFEEHED